MCKISILLVKTVMLSRIMGARATSSASKPSMIKACDALPGRAETIKIKGKHGVTGNTLTPPFPDNMEMAMFAMGCFWGAERKLWQTKGVFSTQVGYSAGFTPNPTYEEVCSERTGHNEVVRVVFDPAVVPYANLISVFFDNHNPTQGNRQGNDVGTQYRSGIYTYGEDQEMIAKTYRKAYQEILHKAQKGDITTEIMPASEFYYAETNHQQYLHTNPGGYCSMAGIRGVSACPQGLKVNKDEL